MRPLPRRCSVRVSSKHGILIVALVLSACSLNSSLGGGSNTTWGTSSGSSTTSPEAPTAGANGKLVMIDLIGKTADEAEAALRAAGFTPSFEVNRIMLECDGVEEVGRIKCQSPQAGALADRRAIINVNVYEGAHRFTSSLVRAQLEKVVGMTIADAKAYLKRLGHDGEVAVWEQPVFSKSCAANKVCGVAPEGGT